MTDDDNNKAEEEAAEDTGGKHRGPGRPRKELPQIGGENGDNSMKDIIGEIRDTMSKVDEFATQRENINQQIQALREKMFARGIPKEAFDLAIRYKEWPEDKRRNFDLAYALCREAVGEPMQKDFLKELDTA